MNPANLKTEDEARKLWCPHVRASRSTESAFNRIRTGGEDYPNPERCRCIASECSQWLWGISDDFDGVVAYRKTARKGSPGHFDNAPLGYCGLTRERDK